jgi:hypothetical protein
VVVAPPHVAPVAALESATLAMILEEEHRLDLDRPVHSYLPEFNAAHKATITPRMLLTHSGGLEAGAPRYLKYRGRAQFLEQINARPGACHAWCDHLTATGTWSSCKPSSSESPACRSIASPTSGSFSHSA